MFETTLIDMTHPERVAIITMVATLLERVATQAQQRRDKRAAQNAICLAMTIRGCCAEIADRDLHAAELLVEQGIVLLADMKHRFRRKTNRMRSRNRAVAVRQIP